MLMNQEKRLVYIDPPRTGSTSLVTYFMEKGFIGDYINSITRHRMPPPWELLGYTIMISVRHPVARAWSLYHHRKVYIKDLEPIDFAISLLERTAWYWDYVTCSDYARPFKKVKPIRLEYIEEDLRKLGFYESPPHINALSKGDIPIEFAQLATEWGKEDIERWYNE